MKRKSSYLIFAFLCINLNSIAQTILPNLSEKANWNLINRYSKAISENGKNGIFLNALPGDGAMVLKGVQFSSGTIEVDIKGADIMGQSFVGIVFHLQQDSSYDAVYLRPFNFFNADTLRRNRSVQYISMPNYPWEKLREQWPGKYEHKVTSVQNANDWFHLKLIVNGNTIKAFVNSDPKPCLEVQKLTSTKSGEVALWVGNNSSGAFANLKVTSQ
ncbi:MAG: hypothetical protein H7Y13_10615 [Sphingobacteriaceae bacterium]|nr:hypothetical protein [Sphingobacteriaceae bacterium]